jgi:2-phospho-L-lactate guanylyltransferase (CobY/MobA/RfbA family)
VVASPDFTKNGTNALLIHPPGLIQYAYGNGSFHRHVSAAREANAILHVYESDRIKLDVDTSEDLIQYGFLANGMGENVIDYTLPLREGEILENPILNGGHHG